MEGIGFELVLLALKYIVSLVFHITPWHKAEEEVWETIETAFWKVKSVDYILGRAQHCRSDCVTQALRHLRKLYPQHLCLVSDHCCNK